MKLWLHAGFFSDRYLMEYNHYAYAFAHAVNQSAMLQGKPPPVYGILENSVPWSRFEPKPGVYNYLPLSQALEWCKKYNLKFAIKLSDKAWHFPPYRPENFTSSLPSDLSFSSYPTEFDADGVIQNESMYAFQKPNSRVFVAKRWNATVRDRFYTLIKNILDRYSNHPSWYALISPETSLAVSSRAHLDKVGYPGTKWYADYVIDRAEAFNKLTGDVNLFWALNWLPLNKDASEHARVATRLLELGVGLEAVDVWPWTAYESLVYPQFERFPQEKRWSNLTGETVSTKMDSTQALDYAKGLNLGHLGVQQLGGSYDWLYGILPQWEIYFSEP